MELTGPLKLTLAVVQTGLLAAGFYLLDWQPRLAQLARVEQRLQARECRRDGLRQRLAELPGLKREAQELQERLKETARAGLDGQSADRMLKNYLHQMRAVASQQDMRICILQSPPASQVEGLRAQGYQVQMTGRFDTVLSFMQNMPGRLVAFDGLSLSPHEEGVPGASPMLDLQLPVTAYLPRGGPRGGGEAPPLEWRGGPRGGGEAPPLEWRGGPRGGGEAPSLEWRGGPRGGGEAPSLEWRGGPRGGGAGGGMK